MNWLSPAVRRGDLADCRVRIQKKTTEVVGLEHVASWTDIGATPERPVRYRHAHYAQYEQSTRSSEAVREGVTSVWDVVTLTMDYLPGVDATCRVLFRGRETDAEAFDIIAPPENLHNQNRTIILRVRKTEVG